ncbi:MAG: hypothetical protein LBQ58_05680, partial [Synergistaceae bacterium]|nr:hypothetical protein [Synergistaceae bacterium]
MKNWCRRCTSLIVLVSMLTFSIYSPALAAAPAVPYGAAANNNFSKVIYDYWWNNLINKITDVTWNIPVFNESVHGKMLSQTANPYVTTQEEMMDFIRSLPDTYMRWDVIGSVTTYDTSTETNPPRQPLRNFEFPLVVFSKPPVFDPAELKALNKPIYYVHGSVHANEPSGYEALLLIMQKLSTDEFHILDRISVVIAPRYNLDGAYWFQRGTNTIRGINNVDQNRDGTMFASPQTRIINSILNAYRPEMGLDPHEMG